MHRSCTFVDGLGGTFDVDVEDLETSRADPLGKYLVWKCIKVVSLTCVTKDSHVLYV